MQPSGIFTQLFDKLFLAKFNNEINEPDNTSSKSISHNDAGIFNPYLNNNDCVFNTSTNVNPPVSVTPMEGNWFPENPASIVTLPREPLPEPEIPVVEEVLPEEEVEEEPIEEPVNKDVDIHINKIVNGRTVDFTYNQADLEDYIIHNSSHFGSIDKIRAKSSEERTESESNLLEEFDNMVKYVINAGVEYGVEPQFILAIIKQEVGFNGLSPDVVGRNGNGYMQLTSIVITSILGGTRKGQSRKSDEYKDDTPKVTMKKTMIKNYGAEMIELLESRGFNLNCTKANEKMVLADKIWKYIQTNKDPEFNIRMGTLHLRKILSNANGNVREAAKNYNGNKSIAKNGNQVRENYANKVDNYLKNIKTHKCKH